MTYRERRERKAEQLREFADGRERKANAAHEQAHAIADVIPLGQPVLVGHHSQRRHERDLNRIESNMRAMAENAHKADEMRSRADNIEAAADRAIYDDDPDAVERLRERIAALEAERDRRKQANAAFRKEHKAELAAMHPYDRHQAIPFPSYNLSNLTGNIGRLRKRLTALSAPETGRWLQAKYEGECRACGAATNPGDRIMYFRRTRSVECESCATPREAA